MNTRLHSNTSAHTRNSGGIGGTSSATRESADETMVLLGKFVVHPQFFETIEWRVTDILPHLRAGVAYTPSELIGADLWDDVTSLGQRQATLCLKHMATIPGAALCAVAHSGSDLTMFELTAAADDMA